MKRIILSIIMVLIFIIASTGFSAGLPYEVHFLDAGQSDCILIKGESGNYLIDTGAAYYSDSILKYLHMNGVKAVRSIIITHYHDDHYGGLAKLCEKLKVDEVCVPIYKSETGESLLKSVIQKGIKIRFINNNYVLMDGKINLKAIGPLRYDKKNENNNSLVLQGKIDGISFLFTGDCEKNEENDMLKLNLVEKCDVIKIPHHTLYTSGTEDFLKAANPRLLIATCDGIGTPDYKNLQNYSLYGRILRTDIYGNIVISNSSHAGKAEINVRFVKN